MADPTSTVSMALPPGWDALAAAQRLRWLLCVQRALLDAHNAEGLAAKWQGADWHRRIREHWHPRIYAVSARIAEIRAAVPDTKPDPKDPMTWYRAGVERGPIIATITAADKAAIPLDALFTAEVQTVEPPDPYEDLSTFTEVDSGTDITLTATRATCDTMQRAADSYVYKSYGAAHFGNYEHLVENCVTAVSSATGLSWMGIIAVTDDYGSYADCSNGQMVYAFGSTDYAGHVFYAAWDKGTGNYDNSIDNTFHVGTTYYLTSNRTGTTHTVVIRSGSHTGSILDTLSVTCNATARQYLQCIFSRDAAGTNTISGWNQNFDLQEGTIHELAGTIAGQSATAGALARTLALAGTIAGQSSAAGALARTLALAGTVAGQSATAGALARTLALAGTVAGQSAAAGALARTLALAGSIDGSASAAAAMAVTLAMVGVITGQSGSEGNLEILGAAAACIAAAFLQLQNPRAN